MIRTDIAVCGRAPDLTGALRDSLQGTDLVMYGRPSGGMIKLARRGGEPMITISGPTVVETAGEAERLLGPQYAAAPTPLWWVEVRAEAEAGDDPALGFGRHLVGRLTANAGGLTWPS